MMKKYSIIAVIILMTCQYSQGMQAPGGPEAEHVSASATTAVVQTDSQEVEQKSEKWKAIQEYMALLKHGAEKRLVRVVNGELFIVFGDTDPKKIGSCETFCKHFIKDRKIVATITITKRFTNIYNPYGIDNPPGYACYGEFDMLVPAEITAQFGIKRLARPLTEAHLQGGLGPTRDFLYKIQDQLKSKEILLIKEESRKNGSEFYREYGLGEIEEI